MLTQQSPKDMRERILSAAEDVVRARGAAHATTREIARAARCSEGSIYVHFRDKDELLVALVVERRPQFARLRDLPALAGKRTPRENLEEFVVEAVALLEEVLPLLSGLLADPDLLARYAEHLRERRAGPYEVLEALRGYLRAEQRAGRIDAGLDPAFTAALVLAAVRGFVLSSRFLRDLGPISGRRFARGLVETVLRADGGGEGGAHPAPVS
ncbi:MAG TPA: TetR/AcrR family transcriptional regulator [Gaiellaceae bacterium]|nr:TetR/AcrR family transcriptional regulator [Gaiellaceae bacterium]